VRGACFKDPAHAAEDSDVSTTLSCAQCGAALRSDQGWCSLCHTSVEPGFDPLTAPLDEVVQRQTGTTTDPVVEPEIGPVLETIDARDHVALVPELAPAATEPQPPAAGVVESTPAVTAAEGIDDVAVMLSMLAAEHRQNDKTSALADRMGDKGARLIVMFGGAALVALVGFLGLTALGFIF
jgi:hypothetical protein